MAIEPSKESSQVDNDISKDKMSQNNNNANDVMDEQLQDDVQRANEELERMKREMEEEDDDLGEEEPPPYDVTERIKQLNQELAEDPTPVNSDRRRTVGFKEDLVIEIPPEEEPMDGQTDSEQTPRENGAPPESDSDNLGMNNLTLNDSSATESQTGVSETSANVEAVDADPKTQVDNQERRLSVDQSSSDNNDLPGTTKVKNADESRESHQLAEKPENAGVESQSTADNEQKQDNLDVSDNGGDTSASHGDSSASGGDTSASNIDTTANGSDEKVLVEVNGKFEYVSAKELEAMEKDKTLDGSMSEPTRSPRGSDAGSVTSTGSHDPHPPSKPRPSTATASNGRRKQASTTPPRSSSVQASRNEYEVKSSPYGMTSEQWDLKKQREHTRREREKAEKERKKEEEDRKRKENNDAFEFWLKKKREEAVRRRQEDKETQSNGGTKEVKDNETAFNNWKAFKAKQDRERRFLEEQRRREELEAQIIRPREENERAFKAWLKRKRQEKLEAEKEQKAKARITRLAARRSRKSQALVLAIRRAEAFRYEDYYGYRY